MSVFLQPIYSQTVGSTPVATITFNNIPQGFTDLVVMASVRGTAAFQQTGIYMSFNNDSSQSYSYQTIEGSGTLAGGGTTTTNSFGWFGNAVCATGTANTFATTIAYIVDYSGANYKQTLVDYAPEQNSAASYYGYASNLYKKTDPITSLTIHAANATAFSQYSTVTVYGVSNVFDTYIPTAPTIGTVTDQAGFASVAFTRAENDQADSFVVTSTPSGSTTYGALSPIVTPAVLGTSYTYKVNSVNSLGSSPSSESSAITTANSYASIATIAVNASINSIIFNNIPQNYKHLQLRCYSRSANTTYSQLDMNFNSDASNAYTYHTMYGDGANAGSGNSSPRSNIPQVADLLGTVGVFATSNIDILDYTDTTKFKTVRWLYGFDANGSGLVGIGGSTYMSLSPVSSITLTGRSQNIGQYSHFALYGIA
jgi:hypothetical protein